MNKLTLLCVLGLSVLIVANTQTFAAPQEKGAKKCNDGIDNDSDGLINGDDPGCGGGGGDSDVARRVRVVFDASSAIRADGQDKCEDVFLPFGIEYDYWTTFGGQDLPCEEPSSQRMSSAIVACGWCFNTFGPRRPQDPTNQNVVNRWVTINWGLELGIEETLYDTASDPNCSAGHTVLCNTPPAALDSFEDNLEIAFDIPDPFTEPAGTAVPNFEIEIVAPRVRKNGKVAWQTKYTLVYPTDMIITSSTTEVGEANVVTISTNGLDGDAVLTNLSTSATSNVFVPFSLDARQVFGDADGNCCFESPPP